MHRARHKYARLCKSPLAYKSPSDLEPRCSFSVQPLILLLTFRETPRVKDDLTDNRNKGLTRKQPPSVIIIASFMSESKPASRV